MNSTSSLTREFCVLDLETYGSVLAFSVHLPWVCRTIFLKIPLLHVDHLMFEGTPTTNTTQRPQSSTFTDQKAKGKAKMTHKHVCKLSDVLFTAWQPCYELD